MNCEQIREKVSIKEVLESFNLFPVKENQRRVFYFALDRNENTPSFLVDFIKNRAFDFGTGKSYDVISIVQQINQCSVSDALEYLKRFDLSVSKQNDDHSKKEKNYEIFKIQDLQHLALLQYLESRKVLEQKDLVKEIHYELNGKSYFGIGFYNNSGGIEIRNKYSKICLGKKDITLIKNERNPNNEISIFEGFFDYLTYRNIEKIENSTSDYLILNSTAMIFKLEEELKPYHKIVLFLDNDLSGRNLTEKIIGKYESVEDCSIFYKDFKDLNEWYSQQKLHSKFT